MENNTVKQAIVLAAGRGERLYPLTTLRAKVMLPIGNKPILCHILDIYFKHGFKDFILWPLLLRFLKICGAIILNLVSAELEFNLTSKLVSIDESFEISQT